MIVIIATITGFVSDIVATTTGWMWEIGTYADQFMLDMVFPNTGFMSDKRTHLIGFKELLK